MTLWVPLFLKSSHCSVIWRFTDTFDLILRFQSVLFMWTWCCYYSCRLFSSSVLASHCPGGHSACVSQQAVPTLTDSHQASSWGCFLQSAGWSHCFWSPASWTSWVWWAPTNIPTIHFCTPPWTGIPPTAFLTSPPAPRGSPCSVLCQRPAVGPHWVLVALNPHSSLGVLLQIFWFCWKYKWQVHYPCSLVFWMIPRKWRWNVTFVGQTGNI